MRGVGALGRLAVLLAGMILLLCAWGAAGAEEIVYDRAYVRQMADYGIYYLFDIETGTVKQFKTNESTVLVGTFTGDQVDELAYKIVERTDGLSVKYGYLFQR